MSGEENAFVSVYLPTQIPCSTASDGIFPPTMPKIHFYDRLNIYV